MAEPIPPMTRDEFLQVLALLLQDRETFLTVGHEVRVSQIDSRRLRVDVGDRRFLVDVEEVDMSPDSVIDLLRRR